MEGNLADQTVRERIRDVEKAQSIAELKQIISNLEFQVGLKQMLKQLFSRMEFIHQNCLYLISGLFFFQNQQLVKNSEEKDQLMNLEDKMSSLRQQARKLC